MTDFELQVEMTITEKSKILAQDKINYYQDLIVLTDIYIEFYDSFLAKNLHQIQNYLREDNQELNENQKNNLIRLLAFLASGNNLIIRNGGQWKGKINEKALKRYLPFTSWTERNKWIDFVNYAEETLKLTDIARLNYRLQFIIEFAKNNELRDLYYYIVLEQIFTKNSLEENIFDKVNDDQTFAPRLNENVYLKDPKWEH